VDCRSRPRSHPASPTPALRLGRSPTRVPRHPDDRPAYLARWRYSEAVARESKTIAPRRRDMASRTLRSGSIHWLIGAVAALVVYFGAQPYLSSNGGSFGPWWEGGNEPSLLWVACIAVLLIVAFFSALISIRRH
jgi:hypothetical protein